MVRKLVRAEVFVRHVQMVRHSFKGKALMDGSRSGKLSGDSSMCTRVTAGRRVIEGVS